MHRKIARQAKGQFRAATACALGVMERLSTNATKGGPTPTQQSILFNTKLSGPDSQLSQIAYIYRYFGLNFVYNLRHLQERESPGFILSLPSAEKHIQFFSIFQRFMFFRYHLVSFCRAFWLKNEAVPIFRPKTA